MAVNVKMNETRHVEILPRYEDGLRWDAVSFGARRFHLQGLAHAILGSLASSKKSALAAVGLTTSLFGIEARS